MDPFVASVSRSCAAAQADPDETCSNIVEVHPVAIMPILPLIWMRNCSTQARKN
jgi:hypothetical protein